MWCVVKLTSKYGGKDRGSGKEHGAVSGKHHVGTTLEGLSGPSEIPGLRNAMEFPQVLKVR
jgi:hypothetical protein